MCVNSDLCVTWREQGPRKGSKKKKRGLWSIVGIRLESTLDFGGFALRQFLVLAGGGEGLNEEGRCGERVPGHHHGRDNVLFVPRATFKRRQPRPQILCVNMCVNSDLCVTRRVCKL